MSSIQDQAQHHISSLDKELSKYGLLNDLERQSGVPKVYAVLGLGALYFALIFFNVAGHFLVNSAGFAIPAYYSLDALFSASKTDDTQWLTYWIVYAFLTVIESMVNAVYWFPFYYVFKFILILWMALPQFNGAQVVFRSFMKPMLEPVFRRDQSASAGLRAQAESVKTQ